MQWNSELELYLDLETQYRDYCIQWDDGSPNLDIIISMGRRQKPIGTAYVGAFYSSILTKFFNDIFVGGYATSSAIEKYKPMAEAEIATIYQ